MGEYDFSKDDKIVRFAIYVEHNCTDFYTRNKLTMKDLRIDHIIPESILDNLDELKKYRIKYELDADFNINSLLNYLPTDNSFNREKSSEVFSDYLMDLALKKARKLAPKIEKRIEKLKKEKNTDKLIVQLCNALTNEEEIENASQLLFERENEEKMVQSNNYYLNQKKDVILHAYCPDIKMYFGGLRIEFVKHNISGSIITPSYTCLINSLFSGIGSDFRLMKRGFIKSEQKGKYLIKVGDASFWINEKCLKNFSQAIDEFYFWYTDKLIDVEKQKGTLNTLLYRENEYYFCKVQKDIWNLIQEYITNYIKNNGEFNMFELNYNYIKIWNGEYGPGLHLLIYARFADEYVYLSWQNLTLSTHEEHLWNYNDSVKWFYEEFLSNVKVFLNKSRKYKRKEKLIILNNMDYIEKLEEYICYIDYNYQISNVNFLKIIYALESFFLINHEYLYLDDNSIIMFFKAMILLIGKLENNNCPYLVGNLSFLHVRNSANYIIENLDLMKAIENEIDHINKGDRLNYPMSFVFRNIKVCSEDCYQTLTKSEMMIILKEIEPLIDAYNRYNILNKFINYKDVRY